MTDLHTAVTRLESARLEADRICAEILETLADQARASEVRQERMTASFNECHRALDEVLEKLKERTW